MQGAPCRDHNQPTFLVLRKASNHSQTLANRSCVPMVASELSSSGQGLNLLRAETALHKGFGIAREACALKGERWIFYIPAGAAP